jgi:uncharacterized protein YceH (UPF0502 family)
VDIVLTDVEARVLGSLVEKEITTPEYYPLSLNALVNACNQKSNREPLMTLDEETVKNALRSLDKKELAGAADTTDSRVTKYGHRLAEIFNFTRQEIAVLCVLLLRGAQTPGELRTRAERMYPFEDLNQIQSTVQRLMSREPPVAQLLARQPGTKESRYAHLFSGNVDPQRPSSASAPAVASVGRAVTSAADDRMRLDKLEMEIEGLKKNIDELRREIAAFRKQFE